MRQRKHIQKQQSKLLLTKVISGGQTGVDRAGLDAALDAGIMIGGYCPRGRFAEDGIIPEQYPLTEISQPDYGARTEQNVVVSDGTLILKFGKLEGGTALTAKLARQHTKPYLVVPLDIDEPDPAMVTEWLRENGILVLNIAGPRESKAPGMIYNAARAFLKKVFRAAKK